MGDAPITAEEAYILLFLKHRGFQIILYVTRFLHFSFYAERGIFMDKNLMKPQITQINADLKRKKFLSVLSVINPW